MKKRIGILTSSRADYSIYRPLIAALKNSEEFEPAVIVFGSHTSQSHGYTIQAIRNDGFDTAVVVDCLPADGSPESIASNMGDVIKQFAVVWQNEKFDLVFCLGDRFEMFAAVAAGLPYNMVFAHLYGGETTAGAIDDALRHSISHMSTWHFTSCETYREKVIALTGHPERVFNAGALSFDNLKTLELMSADEISADTGLNFSGKVILTTFHPETVGYEFNEKYAAEICAAVDELSEFEFLITLPNNDTANEVLRDSFIRLASNNSRIKCTENLGTVRYLSAMKHCALMLGNTSSGFVEASWFPTKVLNLGNRQTGRIRTRNILDCPVERDAIVKNIRLLHSLPRPEPEWIYGHGNSAGYILEKLKNIISC